MSLLARRRAVAAFLAFAFAYFFSALLRAITATLAPTLTAEFALNARDLGLLAGGYFIGFAATQLPLGSWLDRYGPKQVINGFLLLAIAGCIAFSLATSFSGLLAARVLCGVGVSACLMAPLTGFRRWLSPPTQLRANSWMLMAGSFGMLASTLPVQWLMPLVGWRPLFWGLAALILLSIALIAWSVPAWHGGQPTGEPAQPTSYREVWAHPYFRRLVPIGAVCFGGMLAMQTLWAGPWMIRVSGYPPLKAATGLFIINAAMLCTFLGWGLVMPWLTRKGIGATRLIAWGTPLSFIVLAGIIAAGPRAGAVAWALFCMSSTFLSLAQPAVAMAFPPSLAGHALSAYNLAIFIGTFVVQWGIGLLVDAFAAIGWSEPASFRGAMAVFLAAGILSYGWFLGAADNSSQ